MPDPSPGPVGLDHLLFTIPPVGNRWVTGLASARCLDEVAAQALLEQLRGSDPPAVDVAVLQPILNAIVVANTEYFRFEVATALGPGEPTLVELDATRTSADVGLGLDAEHSDRKLVVLAVLTATGSDLALTVPKLAKYVAVEVGTVVIAPAYMDLHLEGSAGATITCAALHAFGPAFT